MKSRTPPERIVAIFSGMTTIDGEEIALFVTERMQPEDDAMSYIPVKVSCEMARRLHRLQKQVALLNEA